MTTYVLVRDIKTVRICWPFNHT